jgi:hypothetical protein
MSGLVVIRIQALESVTLLRDNLMLLHFPTGKADVSITVMKGHRRFISPISDSFLKFAIFCLF